MDGVTDAQMHISFHGYYKHLTAIGAALLAQDDFPVKFSKFCLFSNDS
jgi:hypothetical protein